MLGFKKLNKINGFDENDLNNAKQNNYAWSMAEFGEFIYVGTGRNITWYSVNILSIGAKAPLLISPDEVENNAEIWRYKKDNTCPWQRVLKTKPSEKIYGFRAMITHETCNGPAIYAASSGEHVSLYKSMDGISWIKIDTSNGKRTFHTKGIANEFEDPLVEESQVMGKVIMKSTILSFISKIVNNPYGFYFVIFVPFAILLVMEIIDFIEDRKDSQK